MYSWDNDECARWTETKRNFLHASRDNLSPTWSQDSPFQGHRSGLVRIFKNLM